MFNILWKSAWKETIEKFPDAEPALTFFVNASALSAEPITQEHFNWADEILARLSSANK